MTKKPSEIPKIEEPLYQWSLKQRKRNKNNKKVAGRILINMKELRNLLKSKQVIDGFIDFKEYESLQLQKKNCL